MRRLVGEEHFVEAITRCKELMNRYPDYLALYESIPEIATYARSLDESQAFFESRITYGTEVALSYFGLGENYYEREDYENAFHFYNKAISLGLTAPECYRRFEYAYEKCWGVEESNHYFGALCRQYPTNSSYWYAASLALFSKSQYSKARECIGEAVRIDPFEPEYSELQAVIDLKLGVEGEARTLIHRLSILAEKRGDFQSEFFLRSYLNDYYGSSRRNFKDIRAKISEMVSETKASGSFRWISYGLMKLGYDYMYSSEYDSALASYRSAEQIAKIASDHACISSAIAGQVNVLLEAGKHTEAIDRAIELLKISVSSGYTEYRLAALVSIARACHEMGLDQAALYLIVEAANGFEISGSENEIAIGLFLELGQIYLSLGHCNQALRCFERAKVETPRAGTWINACVNGNLGILHGKTGNLKSAMGEFLNQVKESHASQFTREEAYALTYIADSYQILDSVSLADRFYDSALTIARRNGIMPVILLSCRGKEGLAIRSGHSQDALSYAMEAFDIVEASGCLDLGRGNGLLSNQSFRDDYESIIDLLRRNGNDRAAYDYFTRYRVHIMKSSLRLNALSGLIRMIRRQNSIRLTNNDLRKNSILPDYSSQQRDTLDVLSLADAPSPVPLFWAPIPRIQERLGQDRAAIIGFTVTSAITHIFLLRMDTVIHLTVSCGRHDLASLVDQISPILSDHTSEDQLVNPTLADFKLDKTRGLYKMLFLPLQKFLNGVEQLVIVPDDVLCDFPFEIMACDSANNIDPRPSTLLINKFKFSYLSAPILTPGSKKSINSSKGVLLALGNPSRKLKPSRGTLSSKTFFQSLGSSFDDSTLPGAEHEVKRIVQMVHGDAYALFGQDATIENLFKKAPDYRMLHIAAHAIINDALPWLSRIQLAVGEGTSSDGNLYAADVLSMRLNCDLVVLSGCSTGCGRSDLGMDNFTSAFQSAGSLSVIASLWNVDDQTTALFMEKFYTYMMQGETKSGSLRRAKLDLIREGRTDPFYWAPFILIGDPGPIGLPRKAAPAVTMIVLMWVLVLLGVSVVILGRRIFFRSDRAQP